MVVAYPFPVETLESVQLFEADYQAFLTWRDSLPVAEQMALDFYGARVIGFERRDTQPLPVLPVDLSPVADVDPLTSADPAANLVSAAGGSPAASSAPAQKQGRGRPKKQ